MADFDKAICKLLKVEGGFSNSKYDSGGKTKYGITEKVARKNKYKGDMECMSLEFAIIIYKKDYWDVMKLDLIDSQSIAEEMFDTGVNCGISTAIMFLQMSLNALNRLEKDWKDIKEDGAMGPRTIMMVNIASIIKEDTVLKALNVLQGAKYIEMVRKNPKNEMNLAGWLNNRVNV
jgi:lysozyme family protein